jgi:hypothetical protein
MEPVYNTKNWFIILSLYSIALLVELSIMRFELLLL